MKSTPITTLSGGSSTHCSPIPTPQERERERERRDKRMDSYFQVVRETHAVSMPTWAGYSAFSVQSTPVIRPAVVIDVICAVPSFPGANQCLYAEIMKGQQSRTHHFDRCQRLLSYTSPLSAVRASESSSCSATCSIYDTPDLLCCSGTAGRLQVCCYVTIFIV